MTATDAPIAGQAPPDSRRRSDPAEVPALSIDGVSHSYGTRRALIDINFTVAPASFTALLGLNGAGKSTLFSLSTVNPPFGLPVPSNHPGAGRA